MTTTTSASDRPPANSPRIGMRASSGVQIGRHMGAAEHAREDADQGDADLHGRQEALRVLGQDARPGGAGDPLALQHCKPGAVGRDQGQLAQGERAVQPDQQQDHDQFGGHFHAGAHPVWRGMR